MYFRGHPVCAIVFFVYMYPSICIFFYFVGPDDEPSDENFNLIGQTNKKQEFTVQLREEKYPEILINEKWSPICGHYFWDNNYGATLFCQKLNSTYHYGSVKNPVKSLESDGIRVGKCTKEDNDLSSCTGACNDFPQIGGQCSNSANGKCGAGQGPTIEIECFIQGL